MIRPLVNFDEGVPAVSLPMPPITTISKLYGCSECKQSWFTVFVVLHDCGGDMTGLYVLAYSSGDALTRATAYLLSKHENREVSWLEAYKYLRECTYESFIVHGNVAYDRGLNVSDQLAGDIDKLADQEEQQREAKEARSQELAAASKTGSKV